LLVGHAAEVNGHRERSHLVVGNVAFRETFDQEADFLFRQLAAVPLLPDQVIHPHCTRASLPCRSPPTRRGCPSRSWCRSRAPARRKTRPASPPRPHRSNACRAPRPSRPPDRTPPP